MIKECIASKYLGQDSPKLMDTHVSNYTFMVILKTHEFV